ncbi:MAG: hypothetical protein KF855_10740 [Acidobacteria bacterium]|nr:hypothetical protein [Acidobacteriota bacterium]
MRNIKQADPQSGFSYVDVMIAIVILLVGVLAMMAAISAAVVRAKGHEQQNLAKQVITSTMEGIMSVKEEGNNPDVTLKWARLGNIGNNYEGGIPQGIFLNDWHTVMEMPGPDNVLGTIDDEGAEMLGIKRQIIITDICSPDQPSIACDPPGTHAVTVRLIQIEVAYYIGSVEHIERAETLVTHYAAE